MDRCVTDSNVMSERRSAILTEDDSARRVVDLTVTDSGRTSAPPHASASSSDPVPPTEFLQAARRLLLAEHGPCAAAQPDLLLATARELCRQES